MQREQENKGDSTQDREAEWSPSPVFASYISSVQSLKKEELQNSRYQQHIGMNCQSDILRYSTFLLLIECLTVPNLGINTLL